MPLRYVLDEHLRGPLWRSIKRHNSSGGPLIDAVRVGDLPELPLGIGDAEILIWAAREQRILVTSDKSTMANHLARIHRRRSTLARRVHGLAPRVDS